MVGLQACTITIHSSPLDFDSVYCEVGEPKDVHMVCWGFLCVSDLLLSLTSGYPPVGMSPSVGNPFPKTQIGIWGSSSLQNSLTLAEIRIVDFQNS